jgi:hypothetical protein
MARRRKRTRSASKLERAKHIVSAMTSRGAQASDTVHAAVRRAGISTRTYRTARAQLGTIAVRRSRHSGRRGRGKWYAKRR